jgi:hypothetical protein
MSSRGLAIASVFGFVVAVAATVFGHVGLGPGYDPTSLTLSDYALFDHGPAIVLAMVALSGGTLALLGGMVAERVPVRGWPTALLLVWAFGLLLSAVVPTDPPGTPVMSTAALVHRYASVAAFVALPAAVLVLAARLRHAEVVRWMSLVTLLRRLVATCAVGVAALWYVAFPGERVMMGLVERGLVAVEMVILFALAMRLLRVTAPALKDAARPRAVVDLAA